MNQLLTRSIKVWGFIFRTVFIVAIGWFGYLYINPQYIGDVAFAQLTLKDIANNILAIGLVLLCALWFFKKFDSDDEGLSYEEWANFGFSIVWLAAILYFFIL
mgnify:CR=1 FL=1